jgi:hypothetical protein
MNLNQGVVKWLIACVILAAAAFAAGESMGQRKILSAMNVQLDSVQTSLAFNRLVEERAWKSLLTRGCVDQAVKAIDVAEDMELELLAGFFNGTLDASAIKYVSDRDPLLIGQLKTFKSKYGRSWLEEECKQG